MRKQEKLVLEQIAREMREAFDPEELRYDEGKVMKAHRLLNAFLRDAEDE